MAEPFEYALMSGAAYASTTDPLNLIPIPAGWDVFDHQVTDATGFEAAAYKKGNEIVISFAGTYTGTLTGAITDFLSYPLAIGLAPPQLFQAAQFYSEIKAANPNAEISFTGHSLGGGLAALMSVFFDRRAVTFDQAPFYLAANVITAGAIQTRLFSQFGIDADLSAGLTPGVLQARAIANVSTIVVTGEFLSILPLTLFPRTGSAPQFLSHGWTDASYTDSVSKLHSVSLLIALQHGGERLRGLDVPPILSSRSV